MLGKDYMLAIIIVNYDDDIWNDQSLAPDSDLPPGWRTIRDSAGTYYWHVASGTTQWQHPSCGEEDGQSVSAALTTHQPSSTGAEGRCESRGRLTGSPMASLSDRVSWQEDYFCTFMDPDSKCFAVRSLGWVEIPEEELAPGRSSLAVNNCIQQLSHSKAEGRDAVGAWGEGQDMMMVLKKDTLSLLDPADRSLIHCQPIANIRVWGVGCNNGRDRDFAFVASDKDTCLLKCHVFRCSAPAKTIATALHEMCSKIMAEKAAMHPSMVRSVTMESISPEDLPHQGTGPTQITLPTNFRKNKETFIVASRGTVRDSSPTDACLTHAVSLSRLQRGFSVPAEEKGHTATTTPGALSALGLCQTWCLALRSKEFYQTIEPSEILESLMRMFKCV